MITLGFAFPLVCWVLVTRTARVGWIIATVLALCVATEIALAKGWLLASTRITLLVFCLFVTMTALVAGIVIEGHQADRNPRRSARVRRIIGLILSVVYCVIALCTALLVTLLFSVDGPPVSTPSSAEVLPLPAGLAVTENRDRGCSSGGHTVCSREIQLRSTTGLSAETAAQQLRDHLTQTNGWQLTPDPTGSWGSCRVEGWLLDRHDVCVDILIQQDQVMVDMESGDSW